MLLRTARCFASSAPVGILNRYRQFQSELPGHLVLMQVGDFYEIYGEPVDRAARILDIATTRAPSKTSSNEIVAMTGFPVRSFDTYLSKLIRAGVSVAIADQISLGQSGRFDRQISRIITPGTVIEEHLLDKNCNNYLLLLKGLCCSWMDVSTGDFFVASCASETEMLSLLARIKAREILIPKGCSKTENLVKTSRFFQSSALVRTIDLSTTNDEDKAEKSTISDTSSNDNPIHPDNYINSFSSAELNTANHLCHHLRSVLRFNSVLKPLKRFAPARHFMSIDADSFRSLDIFSSSSKEDSSAFTFNDSHHQSTTSSSTNQTTLFGTMNECKTALGSRLLARRLQAPLLDVDEITAAHDRVNKFCTLSREWLEGLRKLLDNVGDIERILQRLCLRRPQGISRDLKALARSLLACDEALKYTQFAPQFNLTSPLNTVLQEIVNAFNERVPLRDADGGLFRDTWNAELDELRRLRDDSSTVFAELASAYRQQTGVPNLKIVLFKGDQHVIEVPKSANLSSEVFRPLMQTESKARYTTEDLVTKSFLLRSIEERIIEFELKLLKGLLEPILTAGAEIRDLADRIAQIDLESTFALSAIKCNYARPQIQQEKDQEDGIIEIVDGRHPVLDKLFKSPTMDDFNNYGCTTYDFNSQPNSTPRHFTPNSLNLSRSLGKFLLLTGPNMGGKSTFLRQTALIVLMAQCGSFVPAALFKFTPVDSIFTRIGASDDLSRDRSTFMMEMHETCQILHNATPRSLVLVDEIGRGTSAREGLALAAAISKHLLMKNRSFTLFATHYHEISSLHNYESDKTSGDSLVQFACTDAEIDPISNNLILIPKIKSGIAKHSFALPVAGLAGIPDSVIKDAETFLKNKEEL